MSFVFLGYIYLGGSLDALSKQAQTVRTVLFSSAFIEGLEVDSVFQGAVFD